MPAVNVKKHLDKAKSYIEKGDGYHRKAAEEIVAAIKEDPTLSHAVIAERVGKSKRWVGHLVQSFTNAQDLRDFKVEWGTEKPTTTAKKVLRDSEKRQKVIADLDPAELEAIRHESTQIMVDRARAQRREHDETPTVRELTEGDPFDPAEYWADTLVIRVNRNARELASLIDRAGGLLFGTMTPEEAFDYLHESERLIAEARAAAQEQARDRTEVS